MEDGTLGKKNERRAKGSSVSGWSFSLVLNPHFLEREHNSFSGHPSPLNYVD